MDPPVQIPIPPNRNIDGKLMFQQLINHKVTEAERIADSAWLQRRHGKPVTKKFKRTSHNENYLKS